MMKKLFPLLLLCILVGARVQAQNQKPVIADPNVEIANRTDASIKLILPEATDDNTTWDKLEYTVMWLNADEEGAEIQVRTQKGINTFEIYGLQSSANYYYFCSVKDEAGLVSHYEPFTLKTPAKRYGVRVKGIEIDADNYDDVLKDGGSVSFKPAANSKKAVVYLNNAKVEYAKTALEADIPIEIVFRGKNNLTSTERQGLWACKDVVIRKDVRDTGDCELVVKGDNIAARFDGNVTLLRGKMIFKSDGKYGFYMADKKLTLIGTDGLDIAAGPRVGSGIAIYNCASYEHQRCDLETPDMLFDYVPLVMYSGHEKRFMPYNNNGINIDCNVIRSTFRGLGDEIHYNVYFAGVEVTSRNYFDVLNDNGSVTYSRSTRTFTLSSANWDVGSLKSPSGQTIFESKDESDDAYTFVLKGKNVLTCQDKGFYADAKTTFNFKGYGSLYVEAQQGAAMLTKGHVKLLEECNMSLRSINAAALYCDSLVLDHNSLTMSSLKTRVVRNCGAFDAGGATVQSPFVYDKLKKNFVNTLGNIAEATTIVIEKSKDVVNKFDVNQDAVVNAADVVCIYNYIALGTSSGVSKERANVNGDENINAADVVTLYNYITNGQ